MDYKCNFCGANASFVQRRVLYCDSCHYGSELVPEMPRVRIGRVVRLGVSQVISIDLIELETEQTLEHGQPLYRFATEIYLHGKYFASVTDGTTSAVIALTTAFQLALNTLSGNDILFGGDEE